jgi:hypothetical protein
MKCLIHIESIDPEEDRDDEYFDFFGHLAPKEGKFFLVSLEYLDRALNIFAKKYPGRAISAYTLYATGLCPAGEFIKSVVTEDGILPA